MSARLPIDSGQTTRCGQTVHCVSVAKKIAQSRVGLRDIFWRILIGQFDSIWILGSEVPVQYFVRRALIQTLCGLQQSLQIQRLPTYYYACQFGPLRSR